MHRSLGKITDENVVILIINKICTAKSSYYNAVNLVISLSCGRGTKKSLHTSFPISHFEALLLFYLVIYVMNRTVVFQTYWNTLDAEHCFWYQWVRSGVIIKCSEHEREVVGAPLRSHTMPDTATQMWLFVNDCPPGFNRVTAHYHLQKTL